MSISVIAVDLGTGGAKAGLFRDDGACLAEHVAAYETAYPSPLRHEQRPQDWWEATQASIAALVAAPGVDAGSIRAIALSGQSLACIPLDDRGEPLQERVPIWSDGRAEAEAEAFFAAVDNAEWYRTTGNGFPAPLYTLFKILWLRAHEPGIFPRIRAIIGSKDYINLKLTGRIITDRSYASGLGAYDLRARRYSCGLLKAAGLDAGLLPQIVASTDIVGDVRPEIANALGLPQGVKVMAGGVDNACMALGAATFAEGDTFIAMGSSSWLNVASAEPVLDARVKPYVFDHVAPGMYLSATSIFSSGTSLSWVRDRLMHDIVGEAEAAGRDSYDAVMDLALAAPRGARGLLFVPTLGGGTSFEGGPAVRGGFVGLGLQHGRAEIMRATFEGIALALRVALDELRRLRPLSDAIVMVGGGARSPAWRQMVADILGCTIIKMPIDQQAAALGAAALAFVGMGVWPDFSPLRALAAKTERSVPDPTAAAVYAAALDAYRLAARQQHELSGAISALRDLST